MNRVSINLLIAAVVTLVMTACSHSDRFEIKGDVKGLGDAMVRFSWYSSDGVNTVTAQCADGKFSLKGQSPGYAVGELTADGVSLGRMMVRDGDKITVEGRDAADVRLKGGSGMKDLARFMRDNADLLSSGDSGAKNRAVEQFIDDKGLTPAAAFLLVTIYDTEGHEAESLALFERFAADEALAPVVGQFAEALRAQHEAAVVKVMSFNIKEAGDTLVKYSPRAQSATLIAFTGEMGGAARGQMAARWRKLASRYPQTRLKVMEMALQGDSARWLRMIEGDTAVNWLRFYVPGGPAGVPARRLDVPRVPFFIVADSTGAQRYRGGDFAAASDSVAAIIR